MNITSPLEMWDAAYECKHGKLPHQPCRGCGRYAVTDEPYPGVRAIVTMERENNGEHGNRR